MKRLLILVLFVILLTGCAGKAEPKENSVQKNPQKKSEVNSSLEEEGKIPKEDSEKEIKEEIKNIYEINYNDDFIPGASYNFIYTEDTNTLSGIITNYSSAIDMESTTNEYNLVIQDISLQELIKEAFMVWDKLTDEARLMIALGFNSLLDEPFDTVIFTKDTFEYENFGYEDLNNDGYVTNYEEAVSLISFGVGKDIEYTYSREELFKDYDADDSAILIETDDVIIGFSFNEETNTLYRIVASMIDNKLDVDYSNKTITDDTEVKLIKTLFNLKLTNDEGGAILLPFALILDFDENELYSIKGDNIYNNLKENDLNSDGTITFTEQIIGDLKESINYIEQMRDFYTQ